MSASHRTRLKSKKIRLSARHVPHIVAAQSLASYNKCDLFSFTQPVDVDAELQESRAAIQARRSSLPGPAGTYDDLRGP
jgi:hypothetical protein